MIVRTLISTTNISVVLVLNLSDKQHVINKGTLIGTCEDKDRMRRYRLHYFEHSQGYTNQRVKIFGGLSV